MYKCVLAVSLLKEQHVTQPAEQLEQQQSEQSKGEEGQQPQQQEQQGQQQEEQLLQQTVGEAKVGEETKVERGQTKHQIYALAVLGACFLLFICQMDPEL